MRGHEKWRGVRRGFHRPAFERWACATSSPQTRRRYVEPTNNRPDRRIQVVPFQRLSYGTGESAVSHRTAVRDICHEMHGLCG